MTTSGRAGAKLRLKTSRLALIPGLAIASLAGAQDVPPVEPPKTIAREQIIYVPFEKFEQVFENQEHGVFLPYREL